MTIANITVLVSLLMVSPLVHAASPYAGNQGNPSTTTVNGYTKKDGTYAAPYQRTSPNRTQRDNWSSKPNENPYTGKEGTKPRQK